MKILEMVKQSGEWIVDKTKSLGKKGQVSRITTNSLVNLIIGVIMLTVFLSIARSIIPLGATAYYNLSDDLSQLTVELGTDAASFASDTSEYVGWFWVVGPFILTMLLVIGMFLGRAKNMRGM